MELNRLDVSDEKVKDSINSVLRHIEKEIVETHKAIKKHIDDDPDMRQMRDLIVTIDGIGQKTLERLLAELGDLRKYSDPRQLVAAAGLNPKLQGIRKAQRSHPDLKSRVSTAACRPLHARHGGAETQ